MSNAQPLNETDGVSVLDGSAVGVARKPPEWTPHTTVLPAGTTIALGALRQVAPHRNGRDTVVIANVGANPAIIARSQNPGQDYYVDLAAGGVWNLETEGEVWAGSILGTTIGIIETWWPQLQGPIENISEAVKGEADYTADELTAPPEWHVDRFA